MHPQLMINLVQGKTLDLHRSTLETNRTMGRPRRSGALLLRTGHRLPVTRRPGLYVG